MTVKNVNIWIWLEAGKLMKAIFCADEGVINIYDEEENLILKRSGLTRPQLKEIECNIMRYGAKRLDQHAEPFKFL